MDHVFRNYSLVSVDAPALVAHARLNPRRSMDVELELTGLPPMRLLLEENDILSSDYQLVTGSSAGRQVYEKPTSIKTYRGKLANDPNSNVYLTITQQTVFGVIKTTGKEYYIEPLGYLLKQAPLGISILYEAKDVIPDHDAKCGSEEVEQRAPQLMDEMNQRASGTCRMIEMAIASDYSMLQKYSSAAIVQERNIGIMNLMVGIFREAQIGTQYLEFKVSGQYVSISAVTDPYLPNYAGLDANTLLDNFRNWGQAGSFGFAYDIAQLWTARNFSGGVIGLAYIGGACNAMRYQLLEDFSGSGLVKATVAAHETGHNLNVQHDAPGSPYIMAPSISDPPYTTFSPASITTMEQFIIGPGGSCFSSCLTNLVAQFSPSVNAACVGQNLNFTDYSVGGVQSRTWNFGAGATPATSTAETVEVRYSSAGLKEITLTVSNGINTSTITKTIMVSTSRSYCHRPGSPTSTPTSEFGTLISFALGDIDMTKSTVFINRNEFVNESCNNVARLVPGTTAMAKASIGTQHIFGFISRPTKLRVLLDFNDDGDFLDENEVLYTSPECTEAVVEFPVSIPQWPPVVNKFLRLRVEAFACSSNYPTTCIYPYNSQVYEFSVYFICTNTYYQDADQDGYGDPLTGRQACSQPPGYVNNNTDCNDADPAINPTTEWILDADLDGHYPGSIFIGCTPPNPTYVMKTTQLPGDCNDNNAALHPNTQWIIDADQDGYYAASPEVQCASPGATYIIKTTQQQGDCADNDPAVNAGTTEVCSNGKDDNCNGTIDETICAPCVNATGLTSTNITATSAKLNWVAVANPLIWELRYKRTGPGSQWTTLPQMTGNVRSVTISPLSSNSTYNWQIRAKCGNAWTKYTDVVAFITPAATITEAIIIGTRINDTKGLATEPGWSVAAHPNPSHSSFTVTVKTDNSKDRIMLQVLDVSGRIIETKNINTDQVIQLGEKYKRGVYMLRFMQDNQVKQIKLIKL